MKLTAIIAAILLLGACSSVPPHRERISVDLRAPRYTAGSADAYFDKVFSVAGLKAGTLSVYYHPYDDVVCLQYRIDFANYYQYWSKTNREAFISALQQYKEDYEQRNLITGKRRTKRIYGTVLGYAIWEISRYSTRGYSYPDIEIGYYFKDRSPFFAITQRQADDENELTRGKKSENQVIYFTQKQADHLAGLFDQDYLQGLSPDAEEAGGERGNFFQRLFN